MKRDWIIITLLILISITLNLPKIEINKSLFGYKVLYIGGYSLNVGGLYRDMELKKGLDISGGVRLILEPDLSSIPSEEMGNSLESLKGILETRVNRFGVNEPNVTTVKFNNKYKLIVEIPGIEDIERAKTLVGKTAQMSFLMEDPNFVLDPESLPKEGDPYPGFVETDLKSTDIKKAVPAIFQSEAGVYEPSVNLIFTSEGTKKFSDLTAKNIGLRLGIFIDNVPVIAPTINQQISTGEAYITGGFTSEAAKDLAIQINSGALPVPVNIVGESQIGASVGDDVIQKSIKGGLIGLAAVSIFMLFLYKKLGLISVSTLLLYGLFSITLYKLVPNTLTLSGVAGFILSIGMAVDSNILIFERIKEERNAGYEGSSAVERGFDKAWGSIKDANLVSLIIAFILFNPFEWGFLLQSGPVRGFAVTLGIGIAVSLFTGVYVTKNIIKFFYKSR